MKIKQERNYKFRKETPEDYVTVENIIREAFWNRYVPGCDEHYLAHVLRKHPDFLPELVYVALENDRIVGNIIYTKSFLTDDTGKKVETVTFGPVSVLPRYQGMGIGSDLIRLTKDMAVNLGYSAILIYGDPGYYCRIGFSSCRDFNIRNNEGRYPYGLLVLELKNGVMDGRKWIFSSSNAYRINEKAVEEFDKKFPAKVKEKISSQNHFSIAVRAYLD